MTLAQRSELPIISWVAKINGNQVIAALDNASHFSFLSYRLAKRWHLELLESDNMIETSNGEKSQIIGKTKPMTVEFENITAVISFTVTNLEAYDSLFGLDWFAQTGVILDPKNVKFIIPSKSIVTREQLDSDFDEELSVSLNLLSLEAEDNLRNDYDLIDDYTCLDRMVINYKKLNSITKEYKHPQPRVDAHLDSFQGQMFFSQIDPFDRRLES